MDINLINILVAIICTIFGYIFGSISFSIIIGKVFFHQDPRNFGSKNAGGTNAGRIWGKKVGLLVIILDMLKTIAPIWIAWAILTFVPFGDKPLMASTITYYTEANKDYIIQWPVYWLVLFGCFVGHCYPVFSKFNGGKGVSCFMGTICGSTWGLGIFPGFTIYFPLLKRTKMVSLVSIVFGGITIALTWLWVGLVLGKIIPPGYEWIIMYGPTLNCTWHFAIIMTFCWLLLVFKHRENIKRIAKGEERKISWMKDY